MRNGDSGSHILVSRPAKWANVALAKEDMQLQNLGIEVEIAYQLKRFAI